MEQAYKRGLPLPGFIQDAPVLLPGLDLYYEAFQELSTCRPYIGLEGVPGPIPWTAVESWGVAKEFEGEAQDYLEKMIRALDDEFLKYTREKQGGKSGAVQPPHRPDREWGGGGDGQDGQDGRPGS